VRSALLAGLVGFSIFLLAFLRTVVTGLHAGARAAAPDRLMVQSGIGPFAELPASYERTISDTPGVRSVSRWSWFGGTVGDSDQFFLAMAVDMETALGQYPEFRLAPVEVAASLADRRACVVGADLARRQGWRLGDTVAVRGTQFPLDGDEAWSFVLRGVYRSTDPSLPELFFFFHWDYLEETRRVQAFGSERAGLVSVFVVRVAPGHSPESVAAAIDAAYETGPVRTHTQTERMHRAEEAGLLTTLVDYLGWIGAVVVFATLVMVANAMGIAVAERRRETGIVRALGFRTRVVAGCVVLEAVVVVGIGGALGLAAAWAVGPVVRRGMMLSGYEVLPSTIALGVVASLLIAALGSLFPAVALAAVRPVDAIRDEV